MKLFGSLLCAASVAADGTYDGKGDKDGEPKPMRGACMGQRGSKMVCATECEMKNLGRKVVRMALQGENTWQYQVIGTEKSKDTANSDYKQMFVMNESRCPAAVAEAFANGKLKLDILDKSAGIMKYEANYVDFESADCDESKRGMFLQFGRSSTDKKDFMNFKKTRDMYFLQVTGTSYLEKLGISEDELDACFTSAKVGRLYGGEEGFDYTKCAQYQMCGLEPDWDATTTIEPPTTTTEPDDDDDEDNDDDDDVDDGERSDIDRCRTAASQSNIYFLVHFIFCFVASLCKIASNY